jgi:multidrug transporter EmrE-like cation transporter
MEVTDMISAWLLLLGAIGVEVASTAALPRTHGFREPVWTALVLGGYALSIWLLADGLLVRAGSGYALPGCLS